MLYNDMVWASGGIGRRAGFRILWTKVRGGSSPPSPTLPCELPSTKNSRSLKVDKLINYLDTATRRTYNIWRQLHNF